MDGMWRFPDGLGWLAEGGLQPIDCSWGIIRDIGVPDGDHTHCTRPTHWPWGTETS